MKGKKLGIVEQILAVHCFVLHPKKGKAQDLDDFEEKLR